jgi:DNA-binding PadR family transcriptional regulator
MHGEGMGSEVSLPQMLPFLNTSYQNLEYHLNKITNDGLLIGDRKQNITYFKLSESGKKEGGRQFAEAFQGMQKAGHGECGPDCEFCYGTDGVKLENCVHNCASSPL